MELLAAGVGLKPGTTYHYRVLAATAKVSEDTLEWEAPPAYSEEGTFTTSPSATAPVAIESESVSHVTSTDATLEARINPENVKSGALYQFQLVGNPDEYFSTFVCPPEWANSSLCLGLDTEAEGLPFGRTDPGTDGHTVSLDLAHAGRSGVTLKPGTTYHYRVIAATSVFTEDTTQWEGPTVEGSDQAFTTPPAIESESVSHITPTDVTLEAQINPGGRETTYEVWVGVYPECIEEMMESCKSTGNGPAGTGTIVGTIPASFSSHTVSVDIAKAWHKLSPNSSYIYNVRATNSGWAYEGSAYGEQKVFKTAAGAQPAIVSESVSNLTSTDATLEAQINSEGLETTYQFRLESGCLYPRECAVITVYPLPSGTLLGSFVDQSVSLDLNSAGVTLAPGVEYAYSVSATNAAGSVAGHEQRFTAPEDGVQPLNTTPPPGSHSTTGPGQGTVTPATTNPLGSVRPSLKMTALTNAQKLAKAVKACKRKSKRQRASCVKAAHKKYGKTATKAK